MAAWNCLSLLERPHVSADGELRVGGDVGKLPMLLDALEQRSIDACAICEHRLKGDVIEEVGEGWTLLRTCTGVTTGEGYRGGVGLLLSPAA